MSGMERLSSLLGILMCGCFGVHGAEIEPPVPDAGTDPPIRVEPPIYTGVCGETQVPTGAQRPTLAVFESGAAMVAGEDLRFSLWVPGCHCDVRPVCEARLDAGRGRIDVITELCADPDRVGCLACSESDYGTGLLMPCSVGGAAIQHDGGAWDVYVNGAAGFRLGDGISRTPEPRRVRATTAIELAPVAEERLTCDWPGRTSREQDSCFNSAVSAGQSSQIFVREPCPGCFDVEGACEVLVDTEDRVIEVRTHHRRCSCESCGDCDAECVPRMRACRTPVIRMPGEYRVALNGVDHGSMTVVDGPVERPEVDCEELFGGDASEGVTAAPRPPG